MDNYDVHNENDNNGGGGELAVLFAVLAATPALIKNVKKILEEIGTFPTVPTKVVNIHVEYSCKMQWVGATAKFINAALQDY